MNRELQRWSLIIASVAFVFGVLGAFVPQWIYLQNYTRTYGLRKMCIGSYCGALNLTEVMENPDCRRGCIHGWNNSSAGRSLIRRWRAVEAFIWIAAASSFFAAVTLLVGFRRDLLHTRRVNGMLHFFLILGVVSYVICIAIFASTVRLHSYRYTCHSGIGCFFWGASSICALVGLGLLSIAWLLALGSLMTRSPTARGALLAWCFLLSVASCAFAMGSALSPKWLVRSVPNGNLQSWVSLGPLNWCHGSHCSGLDQDFLLNQSCGPRHHRVLRGRFAASEVFLILGFIFALVVAFLAGFNFPVLTFVFVCLSVACYIVGIAVLGDTFDWWLHCGHRYCDMISLRYSDWDCEWGFAFASAVTAVLLMAILLVAYIIMWCCRKEDRAPDTTQVAVTTIAQPPAPVAA